MKNYKNDLRKKREIVESFNKPNESIKYFEKLLKSPRSKNNISGLGYTSIKEGKSSKTIEERSDKCKNSKPTCHFYGKKGHTANVYRRKNANQNEKPKNMGHFHKCNKQGHHAHECKTKTSSTQIFEGH